jgi:preprotein translocase subunit SecG
MQQLITTLHILISILLVIMVLIQRGKGSEMGAGFGSGSSGTMFGSQGATPFLVKLTAGLAMLFFVSSAVLSFVVGKHAANQSQTLPFVIAAPMKTVQDIPVSPEVQQEATAPAAVHQPVVPQKNIPKSSHPQTTKKQ